MIKRLMMVMVIGLAGVGLFATAQAQQATDQRLLYGYWFYEGYLQDEWLEHLCTVIPQEPIILYAEADDTTEQVGILQPGERARLLDIAFAFAPQSTQFTIDKQLMTDQGVVMLHPGDVVNYVSRYGGDGLSVYWNDRIVVIYAPDIDLPGEWAKDYGTARQWLKVKSENSAVTGWCQFAPMGNRQAQGRWRISPRAAGGSLNLNAIVFSDQHPAFQRMTVVFAAKTE